MNKLTKNKRMKEEIVYQEILFAGIKGWIVSDFLFLGWFQKYRYYGWSGGIHNGLDSLQGQPNLLLKGFVLKNQWLVLLWPNRGDWLLIAPSPVYSLQGYRVLHMKFEKISNIPFRNRDNSHPGTLRAALWRISSEDKNSKTNHCKLSIYFSGEKKNGAILWMAKSSSKQTASNFSFESSGWFHTFLGLTHNCLTLIQWLDDWIHGKCSAF